MGYAITEETIDSVIEFHDDTYRVADVTKSDVALVAVGQCSCCEAWVPLGYPQWFMKLEVQPYSKLVE